MRVKIYSHNNGEGSRLLAEALDCWLIKHDNSRYRPRSGDIVINWGNSNIPDFSPAHILNNPQAVARAVNKLSFFRHLSNVEGVRLPRWTSEKNLAENFIREGRRVFCRTRLSSSEGEGIVVAKTPEDLVDAQLYTVYIPKSAEYRIHVFNGQAIDQTRKVLRNDRRGTDVNWLIRNTANGFVFQRNNLDVPEAVTQMAIRCVTACELDFGAVDIIVSKNGLPAVLEVNTAPGIEGSTVQAYARAINGLR